MPPKSTKTAAPTAEAAQDVQDVQDVQAEIITEEAAAPTAEAAQDVQDVQDVQAEIITEEAVEPVAAIASEPQPAAEPAVAVTARVLVAITIGETRYQPNDIIADLPEALANSHAGALDRHPAAIELALADGGKIKRYEG